MDSSIEVVLDASASIAAVKREPGYEVVLKAVPRAAISSVNWSETVQKAHARGIDLERLRLLLVADGLAILPFTIEHAEAAAALYSKTRHLGLSLADRACLALGARLGVPVLTADRVWTSLDVGVEVRAIR